ncbi:MAG: FxLYD domain-containing protein [Alphaproteobacteria bacterium]
MRRVIVLFLLSGCAILAPQLEYPDPYDQNGIRVEVGGVYRRDISVVGITGIASNGTGRDLQSCLIYFDIVDSSGIKVADAVASVQGLRAGQQWRFHATFTTPLSTFFKGAVKPNRVMAIFLGRQSSELWTIPSPSSEQPSQK